MTTYNIDPAGDDDNTGGVGEPFKTVRYGVDRAKSGDTLALWPGVHADPEVLRIAGKQLTIAAAPAQTGVYWEIFGRYEAGAQITLQGVNDRLNGTVATEKHFVINARLSLDDIQGSVLSGTAMYCYLGTNADVYLRPKTTDMLIDWAANNWVFFGEDGRIWAHDGATWFQLEIRGHRTSSNPATIFLADGAIELKSVTLVGPGQGVANSACILTERATNVHVHGDSTNGPVVFKDAASAVRMIGMCIGAHPPIGTDCQMINVTTPFIEDEETVFNLGSRIRALEAAVAALGGGGFPEPINLSGATDGQYLKRDGGVWVPDTIQAS